MLLLVNIRLHVAPPLMNASGGIPGSHSLTAEQRANECSLKVTWILGQHKKPFTDGVFVKECMNAVAETLFEGKQKDELCGKKSSKSQCLLKQHQKRLKY